MTSDIHEDQGNAASYGSPCRVFRIGPKRLKPEFNRICFAAGPFTQIPW